MQNALDQLPVLPMVASAGAPQQPLKTYVEQALENYFSQLDGNSPSNLYGLVLAEVESPMLEVVLRQTRGNQTKAAKMLGISRGTLRKKLKQCDLC
ncbi:MULTISPECIES: DNA-binding transcriptional regulator Fis [unclassified Rickettsiella]|nr:DNA-binding transcriptional regulator Fis [Candidatus Rickettsiella isopodorum]MCH9636588.1 DNA-binding transcriptional regulator Fis [Gammaproteobacteria bacterium]MDQ5899158.1 Fis family transcriptional regulator, factor for inversion stimulation protein [Pseudomonadota bacterium]MCH9755192.1 DNA-binding transcriptional regulator Fis [Gammaproteobacteria bacterium]MDD4893311.1 DNA-binding transcriptional regulator Fis [Candidatus Rickettsiella isopodorum]MDD5162499.1 DNA-binding transcrip